jgi:hypothetical protein
MYKQNNTKEFVTAEEIEILKNLDNGWEEIWDKIWVELLDKLQKIFEYKKFESVISLPSKDHDDCVDYIIGYYRKKIERKEFFDKFDTKKGNIFQWICNCKNINCRIEGFRKKMQKNKIASLDESNEDRKTLYDSESDKKRYVSSKVLNRLRELVAKITEQPFVLNNEKNDTIPQHACLQLYPHIDKEHSKMQTLLETVYNTVRKANVLHTNPPTVIEREHEIAEERFEKEVNCLSDKLKETRNKRLHSEKPLYELEEQFISVEFERLFTPLAIEQVMRLEGTTENTASAHRSRYHKVLPELLPPEFKKEWENLRDNDLSES